MKRVKREGIEMGEQADWTPSPRELERVMPIGEAEAFTSLKRDALTRNYPQLIVRLSPRRLGIKLKHVMAIANGEAAAAASVAKPARGSSRSSKAARGAALPSSRATSP
jgi:hypothetical protein